MTTFTKGQPVTVFQQYDGKGTVSVTDLFVYSCGKKQMVLVDAAGAKFEGRLFRPQEEQWGRHNYVKPRMDRQDATAFALELGAAYAADERTRLERCIAPEGGPKSNGYTMAIRKELAALHEPRALLEAEG
jgi:hypothetical protein